MYVLRLHELRIDSAPITVGDANLTRPIAIPILHVAVLRPKTVEFIDTKIHATEITLHCGTQITVSENFQDVLLQIETTPN